MYKNNSRDSSKLKGCSPLHLSCNLTGTMPAIGYYFYTFPLPTRLKKRKKTPILTDKTKPNLK